VSTGSGRARTAGPDTERQSRARRRGRGKLPDHARTPRTSRIAGRDQTWH
jgi:hypothetical protein